MPKLTPTEVTLQEIKPGYNYPGYVNITEKDEDGADFKLRFRLKSYKVGMYCAIYPPGDSLQTVSAAADNNSTFVRKLVKDIRTAIKRGAVVEIGPLRACEKLQDEAANA
jgi:hypothetical protein